MIVKRFWISRFTHVRIFLIQLLLVNACSSQQSNVVDSTADGHYLEDSHIDADAKVDATDDYLCTTFGSWPPPPGKRQAGLWADDFDTWNNIPSPAEIKITAITDICNISFTYTSLSSQISCLSETFPSYPFSNGDMVKLSHCRDTNFAFGNPEFIVIRDKEGTLLMAGGTGAQMTDLPCLPEELSVSIIDISCAAIPNSNHCGSRQNIGLRFVHNDSQIELWSGQSGQLSIEGKLYKIINFYSFNPINWEENCTDQSNRYMSWLIVINDK